MISDTQLAVFREIAGGRGMHVERHGDRVIAFKSEMRNGVEGVRCVELSVPWRYIGQNAVRDLVGRQLDYHLRKAI